MELWDLYTHDRQPTGRTHIRGEKLPPECYHIVVHVWIQSRRGEWLISQRAASRPTFPLQWECVGGSVTAGEDSLTGAIREAEEEVGVRLDPAKGRRLHATVRDQHQDIRDVWLFTFDGETDLSRATTDEVAQIRWMTVPEIRALHDAGELVHTLAYFFDDPALGGEWINFGRITPCGECCDGCPKRECGACHGCLESEGHCEEWAQSGTCPVYACTREHRVPFCGLCPDFPCDHLPMLRWRPDCVRELTALAAKWRQQHKDH